MCRLIVNISEIYAGNKAENSLNLILSRLCAVLTMDSDEVRPALHFGSAPKEISTPPEEMGFIQHVHFLLCISP